MATGLSAGANRVGVTTLSCSCPSPTDYAPARSQRSSWTTIDWKRERLAIPERKAGHSTAFPLSAVVSEALLGYLRQGRPVTAVRSAGMHDEFLLSVDEKTAELVDSVTLSELKLTERDHLQEWVLANPNVLGPGVEIIVSEYDRWEAANGDPILNRLDILGIDPDGRLVVVELKRDTAPDTVHMQTINYAAMVSRLSPEDVAELYSLGRKNTSGGVDVESALTVLTTDRLLTQESIRRPRIVLMASDFPPSVTAAVVWA